ncbi:hypothetical protein ACNOYE_12165 [Nannocystaceae bacterium ST9]
MVRSLRRSLLALVVSVTPLLGCAASDGMIEKLYDSTRAYNRSLRWGDWDRAASYLPQKSVDEFVEAHQAVEEKLVVIDYEMARIEVDKQTGIAASQVRISWHTESELIVRETTVNHLWQWHEGRWVLVDERRSGGKPLGIFAEVEEGDHHPWLPGLAAYREEFAIGLSDDEKRKRDRAQRKADKTKEAEDGQSWSLDDLESMPADRPPASFN